MEKIYKKVIKDLICQRGQLITKIESSYNSNIYDIKNEIIRIDIEVSKYLKILEKYNIKHVKDGLK